jgi:glucosylceramidase
MMRKNRREFIRFGVSAVSACAVSGVPLWSAQSQLRGWVTSRDRKFEPISSLAWRSAGPSFSAAIQLDPALRLQPILGFGAALTDASCYLFNRMDSRSRAALLAEFFSSTGLRLSIARVCMGASDYSTTSYSFDESPEPDPELQRFSIAHDREYILPTLRDATKANPDLFLFGTPWSPPGWMKANGSMLGGSMRKRYFAPYADYFVRFLRDYAAEGVKIAAVTVQNEVDTDQDGRMPASLWGQEYEIDFVKNYLGPALERASLQTKIWILDHNYNLWGRAMNELGDPLLNKYVDGVAWHGYMGTPDAMSQVHEAFPTKNMLWTEGGPTIGGEYATDWTKWSETMIGVLRNWGECIVGWNFLLDEAGKPNIGPFKCGGLVTIDSKTGELTRSGQYWAFTHFSKVIQRNARVIASYGDMIGIHHVACENPDGSHVLVVSNKGAKQSVPVISGNYVVDLPLDEDSVTTLQW